MDWRFGVVAALALAVAAGFGGWWFGSRSARAAVEALAAEQLKARAEGAQAAIKGLEHDLLGLLRTTLGNEPLRRRVDEARVDLDAIEKEATTDAAREKIAGLRAKLAELAENRSDATNLLTLLEAETRSNAMSGPEMTVVLGTVRSALGSLYADLAADSAAHGDAARADRMLAAAIGVDPANAKRYEAQRTGSKEGQP